METHLFKKRAVTVWCLLCSTVLMHSAASLSGTHTTKHIYIYVSSFIFNFDGHICVFLQSGGKCYAERFHSIGGGL